jgi:hypothetical protein
MKVLMEVTSDWDVDYRLPNHTYLMDGEKAIAYKPWHEDPIQHMSKGWRLDKRYRKFKEVPFIAAEWDMEDEKVLGHIIRVAGSKGQTYEVNTETKTCSCTGFQFRGSCKHIKDI